MKEQYRVVGEGSYRKRKGGTWGCRFVLENVLTGEKKQKSLYGSLRREVQARFLKLAETYKEQPEPDVKKIITLGDRMDGYFNG